MVNWDSLIQQVPLLSWGENELVSRRIEEMGTIDGWRNMSKDV